MANSENEIANLVYRYAEYVDSGDLVAASALFTHARVKTAAGEMGPGDLLEMWLSSIMMYADGTPRTKHVISNPIIEIDESVGRGTCRSYYTVLQQAGEGPLEPVMCGRYHDEFERVQGKWRFCFRDYSLHDLPGNMSRHSAKSTAQLSSE